jgi:hypothetical protein
MADTILDTAATTGVLSVNGSVSSTIDATPVAGSFNTLLDSDWYAVSLTRGHTYLIQGFGTSSLSDVAIDVMDANRDVFAHADSSFASLSYLATTTGTFYVAISPGGSNPASLTGIYDLSLTDLGATQDTVLDTAATTVTLSPGSAPSGKIDATPMSGSFDTSLDHDWYAVNLIAGAHYTFTAVGTSGTLNDVAIDLTDANRNIVNSQGLVDGGPNGTATFTYTATTTGTFYLAVGAGGSDPADQLGNYNITFVNNGGDTILDTAATSARISFDSTGTAVVSGVIDAEPMNGSSNTSVDHDWYAVSLTAGHAYSFSVTGTSGGLSVVAVALRDAVGNAVDSQGVADSVFPTISYTARVSGTYYLDVSAGGSNPQGEAGGYEIIASDFALPPDTVFDTPATTASLTMNGTVTGTIDVLPAAGSFNSVVDHDWYAVSLTAGEHYTFSAKSAINSALPDVAISLMNANRTVVDSQGVVDGGTGGSTITFTAPTTGTYYLDVSAGGSNAATATGGYQITTTDNPDHLVINLVADASVTAEFGANYQTSTFWTGVEAAASFFENTFFDPITVTIDVGWGEVDGQRVPSNDAESLRLQTSFTFNQVIAALTKDAQSANDATALAHLPTTDPGPGGADFKISDAEARALGLSTTAPAQDGFVGIATDWDPTAANFVGVVEHEISEVLGRASGINASTGVFTGSYSVLDLFRYSAGTPEPSSATGPGGSTYFSIDGGATALKTFSSTAGEDPGGDWAPGGANDAFNAILPNATAPVSAADLTEMDVLGFDTQQRATPVTTGGIDYRVPVNGSTTATPTSFIGAPAIAAAGYQFAIEYIGTAGNAGFLRAGDSAALVQQGLSIVSVYAKAGMSDRNRDSSYSNAWVNYFNNNGALGQGTADAIDAINAAKAAGQTSGAIYFDINLDPADGRSGITQAAALAEIDEYFREINAYFTQAGAPYSIGVYGAGDTLSFLQADASAGVQDTWLSDTWLNEIGAVTSKNLEQTDTSGGAIVGGQSVDLDTAYTSAFGQWNTASIEAHGAASLVAVGQNFFLDPVGGGSGVELKQHGAPVVASQFAAGVGPIAAEQTASGYEVVFESTANNQFSVWTTDANGNFISTILAKASPTSSALEALEPSFQQDLNGDGFIGVPTVIESHGVTSLVEGGQNFFLDPVGGGPGVELKQHGAPVVASQFAAGVGPIAAEQTAGGFEVAFESTANNQFSVWTTDANGNFIATILAKASPTNSALEALEPSFQQDLNGDGFVGAPPATTIESHGVTSLVEVGQNFFLDPVGGGSGIELKGPGGAPVVASQFAAGVGPIAAEQTSSGYEVAFEATASNQFSVWTTDANGNFIATILAKASVTNSALEALEPSFQQDLNGDGFVGPPPSGSAGGGDIVSFATSGADIEMSGFMVDAGTIVTGSDPVDLTDIDYSARPTLLYTENSTNSGGILAVTDGTHTHDVSLFGQYTQSAFTLAPDNTGGTLVYYPPGNAAPLEGSLIPSGTFGTIVPDSVPPAPNGIVAVNAAASSAATMAIGAPITILPAAVPDPIGTASFTLRPGQ